ncbi:MAG: hypothetical protein ACYDBJ_21035 [Aggregatilineales bacterium]
MATTQRSTITDEVLDFLISAPKPDQIIAYHASESAQERLRMLLDANRNGILTAQERVELDEMSRVDHFFTLIKARAMKALKDRETATPA